jgi:quercetin dioxygenase-like cupin family protein
LRRALFRSASVAALAVVVSSAARAQAGVQPEENRIADILQSALVAHGAEVNRCFERALADTLDVSGKIELAVDVGAGGKITKAAPALDEVKSPVLLACLETSALGWTLLGIDPGSTVVVPLAFEGQAAQFTIKVADAPDHGPPVPAGKHKGSAGSAPPQPPFSVKLLVDEATVHAQKAAVTQLTVAPANRIALHRHPGAELLYVLRGHARVLGAAGVTPEKLDPGMAIYIPASMPHAIENMGRQSPAVLLDVFVPPGPEKVYRDPKDPAGRAAFEVIHDPKVANPDGAKFVVVAPVAADALPILAGKAKVTPLLDVPHTGDRAIFLGKLEAEPGAEVPRNTHPGVDEILFVAAGAGELTVGSEKFPFEAPVALYIPAGQPHAAKFTGTDKAELVQIFAPAGPEDRYRDAAKAKR